MSYVISVRRPPGKPTLTANEIAQRLSVIGGFSRRSESSWAWTLPEGREGPTISFAAGELSIDGALGRDTEACVRTLRDLAESLEAVVYGEEGEELSGPTTPTPAVSPWSLLGGLVLAVLLFPFMALLSIVRLPWLLWKLVRAVK